MFSTLLSFFGGSAFRMIWGEISAWYSAKQDHQFELERLKIQAEADAAQHARNMESQRLQAELGIKTVQVQGQFDLEKLEAMSFDKGVAQLGQSTGFKIIDGWNSAIRAALATEMMAMIFIHYAHTGWNMDDRAWELAGAVLGLFLSDRMLFRRGK